MDINDSNINIWELNIYDRSYQQYIFINTRDLQEDINYYNPLLNRWFHKDVIDEYGKVVKSPYMNTDSIPGVLIINGNSKDIVVSYRLFGAR